MAIWMNKCVTLKEVPEGLVPVMVQHVDSIYWALADEYTSCKMMAKSVMAAWDLKLPAYARSETYSYEQESTSEYTIVTAKPYRGESVTFFFTR